MSRAVTPKTQNASPSLTETATKARPNVSSGRESVESFVFVFLFFLVLGVEAEGFVIPTGSMAPTLMGRHKEVTCPECGAVYAVNADREVNESSGKQRDSARWVVAGTCVNCRFQAPIEGEPNFQGDRIYVMKTPLSVPFVPALGQATLKRWEIAVFKLPEEPDVRYIKRTVGMPDETLRLLRGDVWTRPLDGSAPFRRELRPLLHQDAMQMPVYDDAHRPRSLAADPRWTRWVSRRDGAWTEETPGTYRLAGQAPGQTGWEELRYRHVVADPEQWDAILENRELPRPPRASLITDFYSYNTDLTAEALGHPSTTLKAWRQPHWVGDLTLSFRLNVPAPQGPSEPRGRFRVELVKAGVASRVEVDLSDGRATLSHAGLPLGPAAATGLAAPGPHEIVVSNVDDRLTLRVDGNLPFGEGIAYGQTGDPVAPTAADLDPVGLAAEGAAVSVSGLVLKRDIYYTLEPSQADYDALELEHPLPKQPGAMFDWLADPAKFAAFGRIPPHDYALRPGHYMMLGDNSPWSRDGRAWLRADQADPDNPSQGWDNSGRESWEVPEALVIGKAFGVYWPHLKPFWPAWRLNRDLRLPARPYVEKMRWIR